MSPIVNRINSDMGISTELTFIVKVHEAGLLAKEVRLATVEKITDLCLNWADPTPFDKPKVRALFNTSEIRVRSRRFRTEILEVYGQNPSEWADQFLSPDPARTLRDLKDAIESFASFHTHDSKLKAQVAAAAQRIEEYADGLDHVEDESYDNAPPVAPKLSPTDQLATIFDDVDE